jgi:hypothetical protein
MREWARYKLKNGDKVNGEKMWQEARDIFITLGAHMEVERMKALPE